MAKKLPPPPKSDQDLFRYLAARVRETERDIRKTVPVGASRIPSFEPVRQNIADGSKSRRETAKRTVNKMHNVVQQHLKRNMGLQEQPLTTFEREQREKAVRQSAKDSQARFAKRVRAKLVTEGIEKRSEIIEEELGIALRRARFIAIDQEGDTYVESTERQSRKAGARRFTWRTQGDSRVRPEHAARDGKVYSWKNAPEGGPGKPFGCRCYAEPVFPESKSRK